MRYSVTLGDAHCPFELTAELWYQPIGFRWANNLKLYGNAAEPRRFNTYCDSMGPGTVVILAQATATKYDASAVASLKPATIFACFFTSRSLFCCQLLTGRP